MWFPPKKNVQLDAIEQYFPNISCASSFAEGIVSTLITKAAKGAVKAVKVVGKGVKKGAKKAKDVVKQGSDDYGRAEAARKNYDHEGRLGESDDAEEREKKMKKVYDENPEQLKADAETTVHKEVRVGKTGPKKGTRGGGLNPVRPGRAGASGYAARNVGNVRATRKKAISLGRGARSFRASRESKA